MEDNINNQYQNYGEYWEHARLYDVYLSYTTFVYCQCQCLYRLYQSLL